MGLKTSTANVATSGPPGYVEYEIDVEKVLRGDLPGVIQDTPPAPLDLASIGALPDLAKGAYLLLKDGQPVYAGKTDVRHGFKARLTRHFYTLQQRIGLDPASITFKAVRILVFSNFDVEAILIDELRRQNSKALAWNFSGFGSNDPGRNREAQEPAGFDKEWPIDIDRVLEFLPSSQTIDVMALLQLLKRELPYVFRYETDRRSGGGAERAAVGHADQRAAPAIALSAEPVTMRRALELILRALPVGWDATVFPDRVVLYSGGAKFPYAREVLERSS